MAFRKNDFFMAVYFLATVNELPDAKHESLHPAFV